MMPITMAGIGEKCKIQKIGGNEETRRFLANLGFVNEAEVSIVSAIGGNVIVNIKDARVAAVSYTHLDVYKRQFQSQGD